ncbi:glutathione S-transferase family protein [Ochrobactrum sp. AN78]|uniref:glutathione S-transferase family protein n=1 Tax=Ochrobactrum sp. AN78 TaxID=3039853 RepID=UPI0021F7ED0C|nr:MULTISPECIES: glutathione S-transferase family protein [Brucella/Ochrobactrum group]MCV9908397.1 glutathione S-transferase family protein [Brucella sp. HL-2]MDH7789415.1 glutathione S-transferase [Ochrobactrum sp. AN78]
MLTIYSQPDSGNCYKPRLLLAKLGRPFKHVTVSSLDGSTRMPEYLAKNPNGKVPLLELEDGRFLAESNAILLHLAEGTPYLPKDAYERALVYQWLFFEQYSHEPYVAVRRALMVYPERAHDATPERLASTLVGGEKALGVMEEQLNKTPFLVGDSLTVADIALYAYTHEAHRGGFNMARYPAVNAWLARVAADEGHVSLDWLP